MALKKPWALFSPGKFSGLLSSTSSAISSFNIAQQCTLTSLTKILIIIIRGPRCSLRMPKTHVQSYESLWDMQSPRCSTAAKIPVEIILEKVYPRSCRLEAAIERFLPSCDLYTDSDPAAYIKLCSGALLACKGDDLHIFSSQITPSQALSAIAGYSSTIDWNDQAPLRSVLGAVPAEVLLWKLLI